MALSNCVTLKSAFMCVWGRVEKVQKKQNPVWRTRLRSALCPGGYIKGEHMVPVAIFNQFKINGGESGLFQVRNESRLY